jgi:hypothetical protein
MYYGALQMRCQWSTGIRVGPSRSNHDAQLEVEHGVVSVSATGNHGEISTGHWQAGMDRDTASSGYIPLGAEGS